jgi:ATP-binding cassette subfamily B (MDR/TAP) protein 1
LVRFSFYLFIQFKYLYSATDEATSALDATSRLLVFEAIKRWRANKTTVVITHDLSQISPSDFVYVLKSGRVVEQGYRYDLEESRDGEFRAMMDTQGAMGGYLPEKEVVGTGEGERERLDAILEQAEAEKEAEMEDEAMGGTRQFNLKHQSLARPALRPITLGNWMFEAAKQQQAVLPSTDRATKRISRFIPADAFAKEMTLGLRRRPSSVHVPSLIIPPSPTHTVNSRRLSLQFTPTSPTTTTTTTTSGSKTLSFVVVPPPLSMFVADDDEFDEEISVLKRSGDEATLRRPQSSKSLRSQLRLAQPPSMISIKVEKPGEAAAAADAEEHRPDRQLTFWELMRDIYPTVPHKPIILLGIIICILSGAMTPIFSFLLSRLMFEVSIGAKNTSTINLYGGIVLSIAAFDGILLGLKYFIMETTAMAWVTRIRNTCFKLVLAQDKKWFDKSENSPVRLVQILIKDGDDARTLIATVLAQSFVVLSMLGVGLIWAMVQGWQLTLVGFAIAPVFALTMAVQTNLVSKCEVRNKRARETVAKGYYEVSFLPTPHFLFLFRKLMVWLGRLFRISVVSAPWRLNGFSRPSLTRLRTKPFRRVCEVLS